MGKVIPWAKEQIDYLKERKAAGDSPTIIGRALGRSRNSVMGKSVRLGLGAWDSDCTMERDGYGHFKSLPPVAQTSAQRKRAADAREAQANIVKERRNKYALTIKRTHSYQSKEDLRRMFERAWVNTAKTGAAA